MVFSTEAVHTKPLCGQRCVRIFACSKEQKQNGQEKRNMVYLCYKESIYITGTVSVLISKNLI